jgi:hypothetical protein
MQKLFREYGMRLGLVWLGSFIVLFLVYMFALKPQCQLRKKISGDLKEKKEQYLKAREVSQQDEKKRLLLRVQQLNSDLRRFVTDSDGSANLTFDISRLANQNNVLSFSIKARDNKGLFEVPGCSLIGENRFDISFAGDFKRFAMFLNALERHEPVVFVDAFSIAADTRGEMPSKATMAVSVLVEKEKSG